MVAIACPICRSENVETVVNIPAILLCKCRKCLTAFTISSPVPDAPS